jgi:hypothetical protein
VCIYVNGSVCFVLCVSVRLRECECMFRVVCECAFT